MFSPDLNELNPTRGTHHSLRVGGRTLITVWLFSARTMGKASLNFDRANPQRVAKVNVDGRQSDPVQPANFGPMTAVPFFPRVYVSQSLMRASHHSILRQAECESGHPSPSFGHLF